MPIWSWVIKCFLLFFLFVEDAWNVLSASQRTEKENFLKNEEHVARGFMTLVHSGQNLFLIFSSYISK